MASGRAKASVPPPLAKGTTSMIGFCGHDCARANLPSARRSARKVASNKAILLFILGLPPLRYLARSTRGVYRYRPRRRRAAEQRYELAAIHSITSSASSKNESEIASPVALALLRF